MNFFKKIVLSLFFVISVSFVSFLSVDACEKSEYELDSQNCELTSNYDNPNKIDTGIKQNINMENVDQTAMDEFENRELLAGYQSKIEYSNENGSYIVKEYNEVENEYLVTPIDDIYEDNDEFSDATCIRAAKGTHYYSMRTSASGTISQKMNFWGKKYIDTDFYYIDVILTGRIEIELKNIPSGCDYDLSLYRQANTTGSSYDSIECIKVSNKSSNSDESIVMNVVAGTYYIHVYSYNDNTWNNNEYYNLSIYVTENQEYEDMIYNISLGRQSGDLGALWVSDFAPMGITPSGFSNNSTRTYYDCYDSYPIIRNLASNYKDQDLTYAVVYIWDLEVRTAIYNIAKEVLDYIDGYDEWQEGKNQTVSMVFTSTSLALSIGSLATVEFPPVSLGLSIGSLAVSVVGTIVDYFLPSAWDVNKINFREYLINLKAAMEVGTGTSNQEVVMMKIKYHFSDEFKLVTKRYIDYAPKYENTNNLYNEVEIKAHITGEPIMGKVTGFSSIEDIEGLIK